MILKPGPMLKTTYPMKPLHRPRLALVACALLAALGRPSSAQTTAAEPKHYVFAHYMLCFFNSVEFYKQEIELAQRNGIDGFALNAGDWLARDNTPGGYTLAAERMYEAARQLNTGFK